MARILVLSFLLVAAAILLDARPASAAISRHNPYRSFNISGYNYGSMQWQKSHGGKSWSSQHTRGQFLRRR